MCWIVDQDRMEHGSRKRAKISCDEAYEKDDNVAKEYSYKNIREMVESKIGGIEWETRTKERKNIVDALEPTIAVLMEVFSMDPISKIGPVCSKAMLKNIKFGMTSQKLGFAAYIVNYVLYGEECSVPLINHKDEEDGGYYTNIVRPAVLLVTEIAGVYMSSGETRFEAKQMLEKNFEKWVNTLSARQRYGVWSVEYLLSCKREKDQEGHVEKDAIRGIYYPMHCILLKYVQKYVKRFEPYGHHYLTQEQLLALRGGYAGVLKERLDSNEEK